MKSAKGKSKHLSHYNTPVLLGKKWQMDAKYVPKACSVGENDTKEVLIKCACGGWQ
ncbi:MAG: hypothetical protein LUD69_02555 [Oscillospiraceae bacterium]|nr:hypothetical protein [Oscillospiraceae bacterium]